LYEMASGHRPFSGRSGFELTSAILRDPPPPLPDHVPAGLVAVVRKCILKDPAARYHLNPAHSDPQKAAERAF
jgi:serine/threonine-protein kinase